MERDRVFNLKTIRYGDIERYKIFSKPIYIPDNLGQTGIKGQGKRPEKTLREAIRRAKNKIHGYVLANDWQYWATQTFNSEVVDRFSLDEIVKRYNRRLQYLRTKYGKLKWVIVPEQHKNGAWHMHMFISGIPADRVVDSGHEYYNRRIYNWVDMTSYGFNALVDIGDIEPLGRVKMANYITKYITKDLAQKRFNKKMYWCSRGLRLPSITNTFRSKAEESVPTDDIILTQNTYYVHDKNTGEVYNVIKDITIYNPLPF